MPFSALFAATLLLVFLVWSLFCVLFRLPSFGRSFTRLHSLPASSGNRKTRKLPCRGIHQIRSFQAHLLQCIWKERFSYYFITGEKRLLCSRRARPSGNHNSIGFDDFMRSTSARGCHAFYCCAAVNCLMRSECSLLKRRMHYHAFLYLCFVPGGEGELTRSPSPTLFFINFLQLFPTISHFQAPSRVSIVWRRSGAPRL